MSNDAQIAIRLPQDIVAIIDREAQKLSEATGLKVSRSAIIRRCIRRDLADGGLGERSKSAKRK